MVKKDCAFKDLLGTMSDYKLAKKVRCSRENIRLLRKKYNISIYKKPDIWSNEHVDLLGKMSDYKLAKKLNISKGIIANKRKQFGIKPYKTHSRWNPVVQWTPEQDALFQTMRCCDIARKLNVGYHIVYKRKQKLAQK